MTITRTESPTGTVQLQRASASFGDEHLELYLEERGLNPPALMGHLELEIDTEFNPVLVAVDWRGDHRGSAQVHMADTLVADPKTGEAALETNYDRVAVIDAAIIALQRTREILIHANRQVVR